MQLTKEALKSIVEKAWKQASQTPIELTDIRPEKRTQVLHQKRSAAWVNCLGKELQGTFSNREEYRVFWKENSCTKSRSSETSSVRRDGWPNRKAGVSAAQIKPSRIHKKCEWAIESELNIRDSRQIIVDMSKLVLAAAEQKLFVASHRSDEVRNKILDRCQCIAKSCSGKIYLCFIDHPKEWGKEPNLPCLYEWKEEHGWTRLTLVLLSE